MIGNVLSCREYSVRVGTKKKLVTFHEHKRILQLITKTYTQFKYITYYEYLPYIIL